MTRLQKARATMHCAHVKPFSKKCAMFNGEARRLFLEYLDLDTRTRIEAHEAVASLLLDGLAAK